MVAHDQALTGQTSRSPHPSLRKNKGGRHPLARITDQTARPETHQNLIHNSKEQTPSRSTRERPTSSANTKNPPIGDDPCTGRIPYLLCDETPNQGQACSRAKNQNSYGGERVRTDDPLLAKQVLSQLSYTPIEMAQPNIIVVQSPQPGGQKATPNLGGPGRI